MSQLETLLFSFCNIFFRFFEIFSLRKKSKEKTSETFKGPSVTTKVSPRVVQDMRKCTRAVPDKYLADQNKHTSEKYKL